MQQRRTVQSIQVYKNKWTHPRDHCPGKDILECYPDCGSRPCARFLALLLPLILVTGLAAARGGGSGSWWASRVPTGRSFCIVFGRGRVGPQGFRWSGVSRFSSLLTQTSLPEVSESWFFPVRILIWISGLDSVDCSSFRWWSAAPIVSSWAQSSACSALWLRKVKEAFLLFTCDFSQSQFFLPASPHPQFIDSPSSSGFHRPCNYCFLSPLRCLRLFHLLISLHQLVPHPTSCLVEVLTFGLLLRGDAGHTHLPPVIQLQNPISESAFWTIP